MRRHTKKGPYGLLIFSSSNVHIPCLGYRHAFLPETFLRSLLHVCEQHTSWRDCVYAQAHLSLLLVAYVISFTFTCAGLYMLYVC